VKIQLEVDTTNVGEIRQAMSVLRGLLAAREASGDTDRQAGTTAPADATARAAADLWGRLGGTSRELVTAAASFDGAFTLAALTRHTGDSMAAMKSRWANLGRSLRKTQDLFPSVRFFVEQENTNEGWSFVMDAAARQAVRDLAKAV
jgi:hypothetical protein